MEKEQTVTQPIEYKTLRIYEEGRAYKTTFTKKFEEYKPWVRPNPEEIKIFIPGSVKKIMVKVGQEVKAGDELVVFVAMKMNNIIYAPFAGVVMDIPVKVNDKLPCGTTLMTIKQQTTPASKKR